MATLNYPRIALVCLALSPSAAALVGDGGPTPPSVTILPSEPIGDEDLVVTRVTRISHPAFRAMSQWYCVRSPWNRDNTRVLVYESLNATHPTYGVKGRGLCWGYVDALKSWKTLEEYMAAARPILPDYSYTDMKAHSIHWSPLEGEEGILYAVRASTSQLVRIDVDTQRETPVVSYDPGDGTDVSRARGCGWTTDNRFVVNFDDESRTGGGFEIDVTTGERRRYADWPELHTDGWRRFPFISHGHGSRSADGSRHAADYGHSQNNGVYNTLTGEFVEDMEFEARRRPYPYWTCYVSYLADEDWFICGSAQGASDDSMPWYGEKPLVVPYFIWQVYFDDGDFRYRDLLRIQTAGRWCLGGDLEVAQKAGEPRHANMAAHLYATVRGDGKQIYYNATEGTVTFDDFSATGAEPWGFEGAFLADLERVPQMDR